MDPQASQLMAMLHEAKQLNAELARMLKKHEWVTHEWADGWDWCPECEATFMGYTKSEERVHKPGCALAALLKKAATE
jgi:hypothetical protein